MSAPSFVEKFFEASPRNLDDVVALVGANPAAQMTRSIPDYLTVAGWDVSGDGFDAWEAVSPSGEVIHFDKGAILNGPRTDLDTVAIETPTNDARK